MAKTSTTSGRRGFSRRSVLKTAASIAGLAASSRAITGFPAVHAQEPKVLRYLGTAVNQSSDIAKKVKEDTGITIEYIPVSTDDVTKRVITQPNSFDIVDEEYFSLKKVIPSGNLLGMDARRIKYADKITPIFTKGELPNGKKIGDQVPRRRKCFTWRRRTPRPFRRRRPSGSR
jgi:putative spermidine/putrescine transport system substrate-binding protein